MKHQCFNLVRSLFFSALALCLVGCSTRFNREWKAPRVQTTAESLPNHPVGRWEGSWLSGKNGHKGRLRCIVRRNSDGSHAFYYWATYWKIFRASYTIDAQIESTDHGWSISGERNLGRLFGGTYTHKGESRKGKLTATYDCRIDHGTFEMSKVR